MRLPIVWLDDHIRTHLDAAALAERLAMTGTEVERVEHHGVPSTENFVVGKVLTAEPHPDADRLRVCTVDVGEDAPSQIVCGAPNVAAGQTVAVARPGAVMPDGTKLKKAKLRGVESHGMILAEDEVAIGGDHHGIMVLDDMELGVELAPGAPLDAFLPIASDVLELEITPNRPDCLGVYGVAREVHAVTGAPLGREPWAQDPGTAGDADALPIAVTVEDPDLCPRFTVRVFEDVTVGPSPAWLKARLSAAGQRPINNVVDITNFVMLLTGQPMHAFDLDRVAGGALTVRRARDGETMTTLDDVERVLDAEMVLIEDAEGPTSIAGVMGGARSEVHAGTTRVAMEAATWNGPNINRTMGRLALRSEAGARFEKGLSAAMPMEAQAVAARLMIDLTGARLLDGTLDVGGPPAARTPIRLRAARMRGLLGMDIDRARARETLEALGFAATDRPDGLEVVPPHFRLDIEREADVIEEVARLIALEDLPATLPQNRLNAAGRLSAAQRLRRRAEDALVGAGLYEIQGWSFHEPGLHDRLGLPADDARRRAVVLENPMSEEQALMRTTLLGSLLDVARRNASHGTRDVALWERGEVYFADGGQDAQAARHAGGDRLPHEHTALAALTTGEYPRIKAVLEALCRALRVPLRVERATEPFLHPGRSARILLGEDRAEAGWIGEVHPAVAARWDLERVGAFELDLAVLVDRAVTVPVYTDVTSFPALRQDLAVVVDAELPAQDVLDAIDAAGRPLLAEASVFDVYAGSQIAEGRKSLALALAFRAADRTLTDEDVAPVREKIVAALAERFGGELRA